ncbi:MAG TPA: hypothetical protein VGY97_09325 [Solirubrobacteraceae bacterium]|jgi:hypothetical protein|nr:hypothetical protein [Solirubrobacteraceae bacterium]
MASLDALTPDQRAVLSLILKQGRSYDELAGLLKIEPAHVRERAHAALEAMGPRDGALPPPDRRAEIADFLLSQQPASQRAATRAYLERSAPGRAWARVVAAELRPLADGALPEIPAEAEEQDEAFDALQARTVARDGARRSSRMGGAILLVGMGILVAVVLILVLSGGGGSSSKKAFSQPTSQPAGTTGGTPQVLAQVNLVPPRSGSRALGVANVLAQASQRALAIQAQGLTRSTTHSFYAVWLVNSATDVLRLGFAPPVGSDGRLQAVSALPSQASRFHTLVITRETQSSPTRPGPVVLAGRLSLPAG